MLRVEIEIYVVLIIYSLYFFSSHLLFLFFFLVFFTDPHVILLLFVFFSCTNEIEILTVGDVTWDEMHPVVALCLGFRVEDGKVKQDQNVEPLGILLFYFWYG